jgi:hypothetical protein
VVDVFTGASVGGMTAYACLVKQTHKKDKICQSH